MKSIHGSINNFNRPDIFDNQVLDFINKEGYKLGVNDSYNKELDGDPVFKISAGNSYSNILTIYIGRNGIAIDSDYDCGGNSSTIFFKFYEDEDEPFEQAYGKMVEYLNSIRTSQ